MSPIFILLFMIFLHIVDDYYLQGKLALMKQQNWWRHNTDNFGFYKHDYIVALIMHGFSWTFMIMLPIAILYSFNISLLFIIVFAINAAVHSFVDHLKANKEKINLIVDQSIHVIQIIITFFIMI